MFQTRAGDFIQEKEKCFVLNQWPAEASSKLISIDVRMVNAVEVVGERVGIPNRIAVRPEKSAAILVGSGSSGHLNLSRTAARFGVCRSELQYGALSWYLPQNEQRDHTVFFHC